MKYGRHFPGFVLAVIAAAFASSVGASAQPVEISAEDWARSRIYLGGNGQEVAHVRKSLDMIFQNMDADGSGVSQSDYELLEKKQTAQWRTQGLAAILQNDLDGDGRVTRSELEQVLKQQSLHPLSSGTAQVEPTPEQARQILDRLVGDALKADTDADGVISFAEAYRVPGNQGAVAYRFPTQNVLPQPFDADKDGVISKAEYETVVDRVLGEIDADGNGVLSIEESTAFTQKAEAARRAVQQAEQRRMQEQQAAAQAKACGLPAPAAGDKVLLLGAYEGKTLSNVSIGGDDLEVSAVHIEIEAGDEPLFIVAVSYEAMVWHVTGNTKRVAQFVALSSQAMPDGKNRAAVSGLAKDRVFVAAAANCLGYFNRTDSSQGLQAAAAIKGLIGRAPDNIVASYGVSKVLMPSGIQDPDAKFPIRRILPKTGAGAAMWRESLRYAPGGVADLDASAVVSPLPVKAYDVLPQQAGLAQLLDEGALEAVGSRRVRRFGSLTIVGEANVEGQRADEEFSMPGELKIVKKLRFPAGLSGGHSVAFILGKGVPMPEGSPGHSRVVSEETGQIIAGPGLR